MRSLPKQLENSPSSSFRQGEKAELDSRDCLESSISPVAITPQQLPKMAGITFTKDVLILNQTHHSLSQPLSRSELRWYKKPTGQFVLRSQLVEKIGKVFLSASASSKNHILVLFGDAGVGKTALAQYYFSYPSKPYHFMAWFDADSEHVLIQQYLDLARQAGFLQAIKQQEKKKIITAVQKGLKDITGFCHLKLSLILPQKSSFSLGSVIFFQNEFLAWCYCFKTPDGSILYNTLINGDKGVIAYLTQARGILNKFNKQPLEPNYLEGLIPMSKELRYQLLECTTYSNYFYPRCLLVFDGVSEHAIVEDFLPTENTEVIITSREKHWPGFKKLNLAMMEYPEALELVKMKLNSEDEEIDIDDIQKLVAHVGCLPSRLALVTQEIINSGMSIRQYLEINTKQSSQNLY